MDLVDTWTQVGYSEHKRIYGLVVVMGPKVKFSHLNYCLLVLILSGYVARTQMQHN